MTACTECGKPANGARGLCMPHYQAAYREGRLGQYPTIRKARTLYDAAVVVRCTDAMQDAVEAILRARRARGVGKRAGASHMAILRELIAAGLATGTVQ